MRRPPLSVVVAGLLVATGLATSLTRATNAPVNSVANTQATSTALYCTGLPANASDAVTFLNQSGRARTVTATVVSSDGTPQSPAPLVVAAHASATLPVAGLAKDQSAAVSATVSGGGVVAFMNVGTTTTPCVASGVTTWSATGLSTAVGSSALVSLYNPTETPAVVNVTAATGAGFSAPASFQGLAISGHTQVELDLGTAIVNQGNIGVHVKVLRGVVVALGVQNSGTTLSFTTGSAPTSSAIFPAVTTTQGASAVIDVMNPSGTSANVTMAVRLGSYNIPNQTLTVAPYSVGAVTITPNPAIAAAGDAQVTVHSTTPVVSALATGVALSHGATSTVSLSPAPTVGKRFTAQWSAASTLDQLSLTNVSTSQLKVDVAINGATQTLTLAAKQTSLIDNTSQSASVTVSATRDDLVVVGVVHTTPAGIALLTPLYGG